MKRVPETSVVISTHNRPDQLAGALDNVLSQRDGNLEVVVADNGDNPKTLEVTRAIASIDSRVKYLNTSAFGRGATINRNAGIKAVNPEAKVCFIIDDDDRLCNSDTLENLIRPIAKGTALVSYGNQRIICNEVVRATYEGPICEENVLGSLEAGRCYGLPAKAVAFSLPLIKSIGGFNAAYGDSGEDFGLLLEAFRESLTLGIDPAFVDEAAVDYFRESPNSMIGINLKKRKDVFLASRRALFIKALKMFEFNS